MKKYRLRLFLNLLLILISQNVLSNDYPIVMGTTNSPSYQQHSYIKASNTDAGDSFGRAVAISGNTMVIGAQDESSNAIGVNGNQSDNSESSSGVAYVYIKHNGEWQQQAYLKGHDSKVFDSFGASVAISGYTIVIGAPCKDNYRGVAYVFEANVVFQNGFE